MKLKDKIKQIFCKHDFEKVSDKQIAKNGHYIVVRTKCRCRKCGKVAYFD